MKNKNTIKTVSSLAIAAFTCAALPFATTHAATPESAVEDAVNLVKGYYQSAIDTHNDEHPDAPLHLIELGEYWRRPYYQPEQLKAAIPLNQSSGYNIMNQDDVLTPSIDPSVISEPMTTEAGGFLNYYPYDSLEFGVRQFYNSDNVICIISPSGFSCGHSSWYSAPTSEWTAFLDGVGEAYSLKNHRYPLINYDVSNNDQLPKIVDSDYSPYQHTDLGANGGVWLFYRQSPTSEWTLFTGTQAIMRCDSFTGEVQKGFAGMECYDGAELSKVTVVTEPTADQNRTEQEPSDELKTQEGGIMTPNTGSFTSDNKGLIVGISAASIASIAILIYLSRYANNRRKSKVRFGKH